ncbi:MAG TPA: acetylornithine deacetylase [Gemmatimonadales bacterium]|nr:acetylornithine deacetylase [Gemmatimonadales bacterium]
MTLLSDPELLARLVAVDSTSHLSNLPLARALADYLARPGVQVDLLPSPDGTKANLLVRAGPENVDGGLTLSGHMDTVPAEEPGWQSDPFTLTRDGERYVARGSADMKGFLALAANRLAALDPARLRRPLALLFTYDEEVGTIGARRFAETAERPSIPRDVIIGEPTKLEAVRLHKGMLRLQLTFHGIAAHSAYPHIGRNAIEPAGRAIVALSELRAELETERPPHGEHFAKVPFVALNIGTVAGGRAANIVPDHCVVQLGIRLLPGTSPDDVTERVRQTVRRALPEEAFDLDHISLSPALMLAEDADLHRELCDELGQRGSRSVNFATDAGWLQQAGFRCVLFGPGNIEDAHRANEYVPAADLIHGREILERLIARRCLTT